MEAFDFNTLEFKPISIIPQPSAKFTCEILRSKIFYFGGEGEFFWTKDIKDMKYKQIHELK